MLLTRPPAAATLAAMKPPVWLLALGATLLAQSTSSFMGQCLPVVAPLLTASAGLAPERIGNLSSLVSLGTIVFLAFGSPVLARLGPVGALNAGAGFAVVGLAVAALGSWPALVAGALLLGIGYGPTPPAGSRILQATAPQGHRSLIFSIKQAGAPLGGALAGLVIAPAAARFGWPTALLIAMAAGVATALAIRPLRSTLDAERDPARSLHPRAVFRLATLRAPFAAIGRAPGLLTLTALAFSFSVVQGALFSFSVTYLTQQGHALAAAGFAYACLQGAGVVARVALGWLADRTGRPAANLTAQAYLAAAAIAAYGLLPAGAPFALVVALATAAGFFGASWNGIYLAEIARLAPPDAVADATSGSTMLTFLGYVLGPSAFAVAVPHLGWQIPFMLCGVQLAGMALVQTVLLLRRRGATGQDGVR